MICVIFFKKVMISVRMKRMHWIFFIKFLLYFSIDFDVDDIDLIQKEKGTSDSAFPLQYDTLLTTKEGSVFLYNYLKRGNSFFMLHIFYQRLPMNNRASEIFTQSAMSTSGGLVLVHFIGLDVPSIYGIQCKLRKMFFFFCGIEASMCSQEFTVSTINQTFPGKESFLNIQI